jgi:hypothetical protein
MPLKGIGGIEGCYHCGAEIVIEGILTDCPECGKSNSACSLCVCVGCRDCKDGSLFKELTT